MKLLNTELKNAVLQSMIDNLDKNRDAIIAANKKI